MYVSVARVCRGSDVRVRVALRVVCVKEFTHRIVRAELCGSMRVGAYTYVQYTCGNACIRGACV